MDSRLTGKAGYGTWTDDALGPIRCGEEHEQTAGLRVSVCGHEESSGVRTIPTVRLMTPMGAVRVDEGGRWE